MLRRRLSRRLSTAGLPEVASAARFAARFEAALKTAPSAADLAILQQQPDNVRLVLRSALSTTHLHTQSRIAAYEGDGFYTIGPCGEELLAALALALRPTDPAALHYRHVGMMVARRLQRGAAMEAVLLDRARAHTISVSDPVTGGVHCSLGDDPRFDFLVTSTLASQGPQVRVKVRASASVSFSVRVRNPHLNPSPNVKPKPKPNPNPNPNANPNPNPDPHLTGGGARACDRAPAPRGGGGAARVSGVAARRHLVRLVRRRQHQQLGVARGGQRGRADGAPPPRVPHALLRLGQRPEHLLQDARLGRRVGGAATGHATLPRRRDLATTAAARLERGVRVRAQLAPARHAPRAQPAASLRPRGDGSAARVPRRGIT